MGARWIALIVAATLSIPVGAAVAEPVTDPPPATETTTPPAASEPTAGATTSEPTATPTATTPVPVYVEKSIVVGTTAKGRAIRAYYKGWTTGETHTVLVLGQMHGNEKAGIQTVDWLRKWVRPSANTGMWLIPTMNPDGNAKSRRTNSRGVDLNRNWPTSGWSSKGKGRSTWGGKSRASERETKAMIAFLDRVKPDYIVSLHQPFGVVATNGKDVAFEKRLSSGLGLKRKAVGVGTAKGKTSPTLTGWYNRYHAGDGTAVTVEYKKKVKKSWARDRAGRAIAHATRIR